jgi:plastocyanin
MPITDTWNNGVVGDWGNPANWSANVVPGSLDSAVFAGADTANLTSTEFENIASLQISFSSAAVNIQGQLTVGAAHLNGITSVIDVSAGSLTINGGGLIAGQFVTEASGTVHVTNGGTYQWNGSGSTQNVDLGNSSNDTFQFSTQFGGTISNFVSGDIISYSGTVNSVTIGANSLTFNATNGQAYVIHLTGATYNATNLIIMGNVVETSVGEISTQPPTISGTVANQPVFDNATIDPFLHVKITDPNSGQTESVTISFTGANGTLTDPNAASDHSVIGSGSYSVTGTADQVTADLDALVFHPTAHQVPPGNTVTTGFTIAVTDSIFLTASDSTTSVIATAIAVPPTISGTVSGQTVNDNATIDPFAHVQIGDLNADQTETVRIQFIGANGTLTDPNAASDHSVIRSGSYKVTGTAAQVSADLDALVFTPTAHQVAPGNTVTTDFTIAVKDTAGQTASDSTTSVIATAIAVPPTISGTVANQFAFLTSIEPFQTVVIGDQNFGQTETVTITPSSSLLFGVNFGLNTLFDPNAAIDGSTITNGVYTLTGTAAQVTAAVQGLSWFNGLGTTDFTITVTDTAHQTATDHTVSVVGLSGFI